MNATDLRKLNPKALNDKLADLKEELFNLRFQHAVNQLDNPNKLKEVKRDIARVKTVLRANERSVEQGYAELDATEVPTEDEKPVKKARGRAKEVTVGDDDPGVPSEESETKQKKRGRKAAKAEPEIVAEVEEAEEPVGDDDPGVPQEEAEEEQDV